MKHLHVNKLILLAFTNNAYIQFFFKHCLVLTLISLFKETPRYSLFDINLPNLLLITEASAIDLIANKLK